MRVLLLPVLLAACGGAPAPSHTKPRCSSATAPLRAVLPAHTCLAFPDAEIGVGSFARLEIANDATVERALSLDFPQHFQLQAGPDSVAACGTAELNLEFLPDSAAFTKEKLEVTCDGCEPLEVCLKGTGVPRR